MMSVTMRLNVAIRLHGLTVQKFIELVKRIAQPNIIIRAWLGATKIFH